MTGRAVPSVLPGPEPSSRRAAVATLLDERRLHRSATSGSFTAQEILAALRTWSERYGEAPPGIDWDPASVPAEIRAPAGTPAGCRRFRPIERGASSRAGSVRRGVAS